MKISRAKQWSFLIVSVLLLCLTAFVGTAYALFGLITLIVVGIVATAAAAKVGTVTAVVVGFIAVTAISFAFNLTEEGRTDMEVIMPDRKFKIKGNDPCEPCDENGAPTGQVDTDGDGQGDVDAHEYFQTLGDTVGNADEIRDEACEQAKKNAEAMRELEELCCPDDGGTGGGGAGGKEEGSGDFDIGEYGEEPKVCMAFEPYEPAVSASQAQQRQESGEMMTFGTGVENQIGQSTFKLVDKNGVASEDTATITTVNNLIVSDTSAPAEVRNGSLGEVVGIFALDRLNGDMKVEPASDHKYASQNVSATLMVFEDSNGRLSFVWNGIHQATAKLLEAAGQDFNYWDHKVVRAQGASKENSWYVTRSKKGCKDENIKMLNNLYGGPENIKSAIKGWPCS